MRKVLLVALTAIVVTVMYCYIFDVRIKGDAVIGYQNDGEELEETNVAVQTQPMVTPQVIHSSEKKAPALVAKSQMPVEYTQTLKTQSPILDPNGWELIWEEEFDDAKLSTDIWTNVERKDSFNEELQYFSPENAYIKDGCLILEAKAEELADKDYTSGMVETKDKLSFMYGRIEARVRFPQPEGMLSAFWLLGCDGEYEEIDVAELVGHENETIYGVNHYTKNRLLNKTFGYTKVEDTDAFHNYAVEWSSEEIRWYVDNEMYYSTQEGVPQQKMYIILTLAVGGEWPGRPKDDSVFPCEMAVDYIRLYKEKE